MLFFSPLFFLKAIGAGHGEKMKIHAPVIPIEIRHEPGERMADQAAAVVELAQIGEKTAGIVLRHVGKGVLCGDEYSVAQKTEQKRVPTILNDTAAAVEDLPPGRKNADGDICQPSQRTAVPRSGKAAGRRETKGFIGFQPDSTSLFQMAQEGNILCKIFGFRAVKFHSHFRHESDRVIIQHLPGDVSLFGPVGDGCQKLLYFG